MEGLFARTCTPTPPNDNLEKDTFNFVSETISKSLVLEHILRSKFTNPTKISDSDFTKKSYKPDYDKIVNFTAKLTLNNISTLKTSLKDCVSYEVELVNPYGAYWGVLTILNNGWLHYVSKSKLIEDHYYKRKYYLRSVEE